MDPRILQIVEYVALGVIGVSLLLSLLRFLRLERRNYRNSHAPVCTERALAYQKHREQELLSQGTASGSVFFITFHTDFGEIVRCYMGYENFYIIEEGAVGQLTWQGERFLGFVPEKKGV